MYDLHRLRLLRELHVRGTLAAVADALGYSPSAISHQLAILEREVGVPLLEPHGRRVRLTAAAGLLVSHADEILLELERAEAAMTALSGTVAGTLRVATFQTAAYTLVPTMIDRLALTHPGITVSASHIHAHAAIPALQARDFDLVLYEEYPHGPVPPHGDVLTQTIATDPMRLLVPAESVVSSIADAAEERWVAEPVGTPVRAWMTLVCRTAGFEPIIAFESPDVLLHARLVSEGRAVALIPDLAFTSTSTTRWVPTGEHRIIGSAIRRGSEGNPVLAAAQGTLSEIGRRPSTRDEGPGPRDSGT